jgi:hypothetical protein
MSGPQIFAIVLITLLSATMGLLMAFGMSRGHLPSSAARRRRQAEESLAARQLCQEAARAHLATLRGSYVKHWHEFIPYDENPRVLLGALTDYCAVCGSSKLHPRPILIIEDIDNDDLFLRAGLLHQ